MNFPTSYKLQATSYQTGQAVIIAVIFIVLLSMIILGGFSTLVIRTTQTARTANYSKVSYFAAESAVEDAVYRLSNNLVTAPANYDVVVGGTTIPVTVTSSGNSRTISTVANYQNNYRKLTAKLDSSTVGAQFHYGIQVGDGGLKMEENSKVIGNVYSDGNIEGDNGSNITGDAIVAGGITETATLEYAADDAIYSFPMDINSRDAAQSFTAPATGNLNRVGVRISKIGTPADLTLRVTDNVTVLDVDKPNPSPPFNFTNANASIPADSVGTSVGWVNVSFTSPPTLTSGNKYWIVLDGTDPSGNDYINNHWIWQKDTTDGYANNTGKKKRDWSTVGPWPDLLADLSFRVWLGGVPHEINGVEIGDTDYNTASSTATANIITNTKTNGVDCPNQYCVIDSPAHLELPLTEGQIQGWKDDASAGGVCTPTSGGCSWSGNLLVSTGNKIIGPKHVTGDLTLSNGATLTITGTIWVSGNISLGNNSHVALDSSYGSQSGVIVTDGVVTVGNGSFFTGSGVDPASYTMILSDKNATSTNVITVSETPADHSRDVIYYASQGKILFQQNARAREVTGYGINLENNATIYYDSGLANANFSSGPGGSFGITSWQETQ